MGAADSTVRVQGSSGRVWRSPEGDQAPRRVRAARSRHLYAEGV